MQGIVPLTDSGIFQLEWPIALGTAHAVRCGRGKTQSSQGDLCQTFWLYFLNNSAKCMSENRISTCKSSVLHRIKDELLDLVAMNTVNSLKTTRKMENDLSLEACFRFGNISVKSWDLSIGWKGAQLRLNTYLDPPHGC